MSNLVAGTCQYVQSDQVQLVNQKFEDGLIFVDKTITKAAKICASWEFLLVRQPFTAVKIGICDLHYHPTSRFLAFFSNPYSLFDFFIIVDCVCFLLIIAP